jgi:hypothetical protein
MKNVKSGEPGCGLRSLGAANVSVGSFSEVGTLNREVCLTHVNGHRQPALACPKSDNERHSKGQVELAATQRSDAL